MCILVLGIYCGMGLYFVTIVMILSVSHDTWCPDSCMTVQKVSFLAPLCPKILAGALHTTVKMVLAALLFGAQHKVELELASLMSV